MYNRTGDRILTYIDQIRFYRMINLVKTGWFLPWMSANKMAEDFIIDQSETTENKNGPGYKMATMCVRVCLCIVICLKTSYQLNIILLAYCTNVSDAIYTFECYRKIRNWSIQYLTLHFMAFKWYYISFSTSTQYRSYLLFLDNNWK